MFSIGVPRAVARAARASAQAAQSNAFLPVLATRSTRICLRESSTTSPAILSSNRRRPKFPQRGRLDRLGQPGGVIKRSIFIQTEPTPNDDALKYKPQHRVIPEDFPYPFLEYSQPRDTLSPPYPSPLAAQLFAIDGVTAVFFGSDFITLTKDSSIPWAHINPEAFSLITEAITAGKPFVTRSESKEGSGDGDSQMVEKDSLAYDPEDSEVVSMIKELLETRIRPYIQDDGGDIEFRGFHNGQVLLKLRGACRTCDSSTVTLRNGIESMLKHYIQEVEGVEQVMDQEEEVAMREFAAFEEKLRQQKGPQATAGTVGKGSLDTVE